MDILNKIITHKRKEVAEQKKRIPFSDLEKRLSNHHLPFYSLKNALLQSDTGIIAEFKRCSPSKGWINQSADVEVVAKEYETAGASAISVLTDEKYFGGALLDLQNATKCVEIPILRKEFIVDEYQIFEAKLAGASAILLIAAAISHNDCKRFTELAHQLQLDVLLELHDEKEIDYITPLNTIVGINNRNLGSFVADVQKSFKMAELLPQDAVWVSESGISDAKMVKELRNAGYKGFLIGENFMKTDNPGKSLDEFIKHLKQ